MKVPLDFLKNQRAIIRNILGRGRESPLPIRAFVFTTETEKSLYLSFCQS